MYTADNNGCTPMYIAAQEGHVSVVQALLNFGADASISSWEWPPVDIAADKKLAAVVE